jgi:hypothetical protein
MLQWHSSNPKFPWELCFYSLLTIHRLNPFLRGVNEHAIYDVVGAKRQRLALNQWIYHDVSALFDVGIAKTIVLGQVQRRTICHSPLAVQSLKHEVVE